MLKEDEVPVKELDFERARDGIYQLGCALEDVDSDLAEDGDYVAAFRHLYRAASELRGLELAPASQ